jgi:hypothetical protein
MNTQEFLSFLKEKTEKMYNTAVAKNSDYSGSHADPFGNIDMVEKMGITSPEIGLLTRMTDKLSRVSTLIKRGVETNNVKDESIEDTLVDLANYSLILAARIKARKVGLVISNSITNIAQ